MLTLDEHEQQDTYGIDTLDAEPTLVFDDFYILPVIGRRPEGPNPFEEFTHR